MQTILNHPVEFGVLLAIALILTLELGRRVAAKFSVNEDVNRKDQLVRVSDGLFVLASLLLGFTLSLVLPLYNERRSLLVEEANAIDTTYLRASTLPEAYRDKAQRLLRDYVNARLALGEAGLNDVSFAEALNRSKQIQEQLWIDAASLSQIDRSALTALYFNSLNETIDVHEKRIAAFENRVPASLWILIVSVSVIAVFARGLTITGRFWLTPILIPITLAIIVSLLAELDTPGSGLIRLDQRPIHRLHVEVAPSPVPRF